MYFMYPLPLSGYRAASSSQKLLLDSPFIVLISTPVPKPLTSGCHRSLPITTVLSFRERHINEIVQYITLWDCLLPLSIMPLKFIQLLSVSIVYFFLLLSNIQMCGCSTVYLAINLWNTTSFRWLWKSCYKHSCKCNFSFFPRINTRELDCWVTRRYMSYLFRNRQIIFTYFKIFIF